MDQRVNWAILVLLAINTMNFFDRQILGAVGEMVRVEFDLSDSQLGDLNTAFTLLYAFAGLPLGWLADHWRRTWILFGGVTVWSLLTAASGLAQNFWQLFAIRLGVGVGEASCAPAATSLIGDLVPGASRGRAMAIFMMGLPLGIGLSFLVSGTIAKQYDWRAAFFVAGLPGLLCAFAALTIAEPPRGAVETRPLSNEKGDVWSVLRTPTLWWLILSGAFHNFNMYALGAFLSPMLQRYHGMEVQDAAVLSMVAYGFSGIPGLLLGGWIADDMRRRRVDGRLLVGAASILIAIPMTYAALARPAGDTMTLTILLGIGCAFMYVYYAAVYPTLHDVVEPRHRGIAMAMYFCAMYLLGASLGPKVMGMLSDHFALSAAASAGVTGIPVTELPMEYRAGGLRSAMLIVPVLNAALALVLLAGCFTVGRDARRVRQHS